MMYQEYVNNFVKELPKLSANEMPKLYYNLYLLKDQREIICNCNVDQNSYLQSASDNLIFLGQYTQKKGARTAIYKAIKKANNQLPKLSSFDKLKLSFNRLPITSLYLDDNANYNCDDAKYYCKYHNTHTVFRTFKNLQEVREFIKELEKVDYKLDLLEI